MIFVLYRDKKTSQVKQYPAWSSDMELSINTPHNLFNSYFDQSISRFYQNRFSDISPYNRYDGIPPFHYEKDMHRDANGFLVIKGIKMINEARVISKKNVPLIIPVTCEEFINYTIKMDELYIKKTKQAITETIGNIKTAEENKNTSNEAYYRNLLQKIRKHIPELEKAIHGNVAELKTMPEAQKKAQAYINFLKHSTSLHPFNALTSLMDKYGRKLIMINPDYFDKTLPPWDPQLIVVDYSYNHFEYTEIDTLLTKWFDSIDYKKLQVMIK